MRSDSRGQLDLLLLAVLDDSPAHGYAIIERLRERSDGAFDFAEGSIYPALHRLEQEGLLTSRWTQAGARRRRVYSLSRGGRSALAREASEWRRVVRAVDAVMGGPA